MVGKVKRFRLEELRKVGLGVGRVLPGVAGYARKGCCKAITWDRRLPGFVTKVICTHPLTRKIMLRAYILKL